MDISVIVPIYNVERYVEESLRSLFTQTKVDGVEFILVDNCTPDKSMDIVNSLVKEFSWLNIKIISLAKNDGVTLARKEGLKVATGTFVLYIDSDDWCEPTMLEDMFNTAVKENADLVSADFYLNYPDREEYRSCNFSSDKFENIKNLLAAEASGTLWVMFVKRALLLDNNVKLSRTNFQVGEDTALSVQMFYYADRIRVISRAYYHYRQHSSSVLYSSSNKVINRTKAYMEMEEFLASKGALNKEMNTILINQKQRLKYTIFRYSKGDAQVENLKIFTEIDHLILRSNALILPKKILLYLATHNMLWLANLVRGVL